MVRQREMDKMDVRWRKWRWLKQQMKVWMEKDREKSSRERSKERKMENSRRKLVIWDVNQGAVW